MKSFLIPFVTTFFLSSCASFFGPTGPTTQEIVDSWMGVDESTLISQWGIPSRTYQSGDQKFLEYTFGGTSYTTTTNENLRNNPYTCNQYYCPPPTAITYQNNYSCNFRFTITGEIISGVTSNC